MVEKEFPLIRKQQTWAELHFAFFGDLLRILSLRCCRHGLLTIWEGGENGEEFFIQRRLLTMACDGRTLDLLQFALHLIQEY